MRPLSLVTVAMAFALTSPMLVWSLGVPPHWMWEVHLLAFSAALRFLFLAATVSRQARETAAVGGFAAAMASLGSQILLHSPHDQANLAAVFLTYGTLGGQLYRLEATALWWPYAITLGDAAAYALVALLVHRWVNSPAWSFDAS